MHPWRVALIGPVPSPAVGNPCSPAQPSVRDGEEVADQRGSDGYKDVAIRRWNTRLGGGGAELVR